MAVPVLDQIEPCADRFFKVFPVLCAYLVLDTEKGVSFLDRS